MTTSVTPPLTITQAPARVVAFKHCTCTQEDLGDTLGTAFESIYRRVAQAGVATAGPPFVVYTESSIPGQTWDIDVCAPIATAISPTPDVSLREFPPEKIVEVLHTGPYETLGAAYKMIDDFVAQEGLVRTGPPREIYLTGPDVPPDQIQTVVELPIR